MAEQRTSGNEAGRGSDERAERFSLPQLEFEMALDMADGDEATWIDLVRQAAELAGGDLLFVLPSFGADGEVREKAMVRLKDEDRDLLIFVGREANSFSYEGEDAIGEELKAFARASIDVLEMMQADEEILAPGEEDRGEDDNAGDDNAGQDRKPA